MRFLVISLLSIVSLVAAPKKKTFAARPVPIHASRAKAPQHAGGRLTPRKKSSMTGGQKHKR